MTNLTLRRAVLAGLTLLLAAPFAAGQLNTFGTPVAAGDQDYVPLVKAATIQVGDVDQLDASPEPSAFASIWRVDLGADEKFDDDCILIDTFDLIAKESHPIDDLRLTACGSDQAGTTVVEGSEAVEEIRDQMDLQDRDCIRLRTSDHVKQNSGYDKGETLYLVYYADADGDGAVCDGTDGADAPGDDSDFITATEGFATGIPRNEVSATTEGDWAIRLTPYKEHPAGSWVRATHEDMRFYGETAKDVTKKYTYGYREDKTIYLVATTADETPVAKNSLVTAKSIRLGPTVAPSAPLVQVTSFELPDAPAQAGEDYKVKVKFSNDGKAPGVGLLVTRLDGQIVDARLTPYLDAAQSSTAIVPIPMPESGGEHKVDISGFKLNVEVEGPLPTEDSATALEARIAALESQLAALRSTQVAAPAQAAGVSSEAGKSEDNGTPAVGSVVLIGALAALAVVLRRRSA